MPLVRLRGRAFALALGGVLAGACAAVSPPVFEPATTTPGAAVERHDETRATGGPRVSGRLLALRGLPPGDDRLTASLDLDPAGLHRPGVLEALASSGVPVTVRGPEAHQVDLRLVSFDGVTAAPR